MKNKELFNRTVSILVNAYQKGTLEYSNCAACAVGNLIAANNGISLIKKRGLITCENGWSGGWSMAIECGSGVVRKNPDEKYIKLLESTGYTALDMAKVEKAFGIGTIVDFSYSDHDDENFCGLMKVIDTLMEIHEANEIEVIQAKQLFVKETV